MKKYWKIFGVAAIIAGIIYYPAIKLYQLITGQKGERRHDDEMYLKTFNPAYRGKQDHYHNEDSNATIT